MTTTPQQIDLWRQALTEHQRLEFKEAKTQYDTEKLHRYCVAIANEGGGHFVLGVAAGQPTGHVAADRDPTGARLGQGGGYYDRTFAARPDAIRIGFAYAGQRVERLALEPHDIRLHGVLTEVGYTPARKV